MTVVTNWMTAASWDAFNNICNRFMDQWVFVRMGKYERIKKTCCSNCCDLSFEIIIWNLFLSSTGKPRSFVRKDAKFDYYMQSSSNRSNYFTKSLNDISK